MFHTYRVCAWSSTPSDISRCGKHLVYPRLCHTIRESDGYKIQLILAGESPSPRHKSGLSGRRSLCIFFSPPPVPCACLADGEGTVTQHSIPLFLLNIYMLVKHIKLTASAHITARWRSRIQCGSDSLPRMCVLNQGEQQKTDGQTDKWIRKLYSGEQTPGGQLGAFLGLFNLTFELKWRPACPVRVCGTSRPIFISNTSILMDFELKSQPRLCGCLQQKLRAPNGCWFFRAGFWQIAQ